MSIVESSLIYFSKSLCNFSLSSNVALCNKASSLSFRNALKLKLAKRNKI